jgi:uncharacterized phage protein (TIGR02218 family)
MKQIDEAFAARLAADNTTLCACWRFTRRDGAVFGATDHDVALAFDDVTFAPASGLESVVLTSSSGLAPGSAAARGALSLEFISEADVGRGLWDGARVDVWRVDWRAPEYRLMIWSGRLSEITLQGGGFAAELVSLKADLERVIGRVYRRTCDAEVGDERCGVSLAAPAFRAEGAVAAVLGPRAFTASVVGGFESGWFDGGRLVWTSGANAGRSAIVVRHIGDEIEIAGAISIPLAPGDGFEATAGCGKSTVVCRAKFDNLVNFRGFPHMPGPEAVLAGPSSVSGNTGGRRS